MFRFFRTIRQTLINEGKTSKYFRYAVGEILLIVIGILIALQIQNWNQKRLDRIEERYLLIELKDNLNQEAERLEYGIEMQKEQIEDFQGIRNFFQTPSIAPEQLEENLKWINNDFAFNPITSAYETMKSTGIGFSNRRLKAQLVQYYDVEQAILLVNLGKHQELNSTVVRPIVLKYLKWDRIRGKRIPKDIHDPEFKDAILEPLDIMTARVTRCLDIGQRILGLNREILAVVEQELEGL